MADESPDFFVGWNETETPFRLVKKNLRVEPRRWPYRAAGVAAGAAYFVTAIRAGMPLVLFGGWGELAILWAALAGCVSSGKASCVVMATVLYLVEKDISSPDPIRCAVSPCLVPLRTE
jgi:hypothetical protein